MSQASAFGGQPIAVTIGASSVMVARANPRRMRLTIINDSDTIIYLARADFARLNAGLRLNPAGGSIMDCPDTLGRIYTGPWSAISSAAGKNLCVSEE